MCKTNIQQKINNRKNISATEERIKIINHSDIKIVEKTFKQRHKKRENERQRNINNIQNTWCEALPSFF